MAGNRLPDCARTNPFTAFGRRQFFAPFSQQCAARYPFCGARRSGINCFSAGAISCIIKNLPHRTVRPAAQLRRVCQLNRAGFHRQNERRGIILPHFARQLGIFALRFRPADQHLQRARHQSGAFCGAARFHPAANFCGPVDGICQSQRTVWHSRQLFRHVQ